MRALAVFGIAVLGAGAGAWAGIAIGDRQGGDFNFAPVVYGPLGALLGCLAGTAVGAAMYAR